MSFRLNTKEPVAVGLKRLVLAEIDSAAKQLGSVNQRDPGRAIHAARVSIKKIRCVIRLVRPELGHAFEKHDRRLRDLGRELSAIRDSAAVVDTLDSLSVGTGGKSSKKAGLRHQLVKQEHHIEHASSTRQTMARVADTLRAFGEKVEARPLDNFGFAALARGLCTGFRAARGAMKGAIHHPSPDNYHYWRKKVKNHWYDLQLVEGYWNDAMRKRARILSELESLLGHYHDLSIFQIRLTMQAKAENSGDTSTLLGRAADSQRKLRARALLLGHRLFDEAPAHFGQNVSELGPRREVQR